jgi:hypothetical protein
MFTITQRRKVLEGVNSQRPIITAYIEEGVVVKKTTANKPNTAAMRCFMHMSMNHYGSSVAQVFSADTGRLFAEFVRHKDNRVETTYKDDPTKFDDPLRRNPVRAVAYFL